MEPDEIGSDEETDQDVVMAVSTPQTTQTTKRRTMKLQGKIGTQDVLILVDSGSVGTFISDQLASRLELPSQDCSPLSFLAADGSPMACNKRIPELQWGVQGHVFVPDVAILPLQCYDMILGQDWLEEFSPMWIHWRKKVMKFTYKGKRIKLCGVKSEITPCAAVSSRKLKGLFRRGAVSHCLLLKAQSVSSTPDASVCAIQEGTTTHHIPEVQKLLSQYSHLFQEPSTLPPPRQFDHSITLLPGSQPVNIRPYRNGPAQKTEIEKQLHDMLKHGVIRPSNKHPLPIVDELIDELAGAQWFSKLDFRSGYHQIRLTEGDEHKTTFKTHHGLYEFLVMPFGLTNAPATFQSVMNQIFEPLLRQGVLVFMDDILVYSSNLEEHIQLLTKVFDIIQQHQFLIKLSKCCFAQDNIEYLGHCISSQGVSTEPSKITAVQQWPVPQNLKELRGFLGLTEYYRRFIRSYGMISRPLTQLLKKGTPFVWTAHTEEAFQLLKKALAEAPVLAIPDFSKTFVLESDACDYGIGAMLMQDNHPIAYLSKPLCPKNQALSTYEKECMAILLAVEKWRPYLQHKEFLIKTDHRSLLYLTEQRVHTKLQQKALLKLMDLQYKIVYKKGTSNAATDALSRVPVPNSILAISYCTPAWQENLMQGYMDCEQDQKLLTELAVTSPNSRGFSLSDGIIRFKGREWIGSNTLAQQHVIQALHSSGIGGHSDFHVTYHRIKALFAWPKMKDTVKTYIQQCATCQQAKIEHVKYPGLLQPLPVPSKPWSVISLDFIEGLSVSHKHDVIMVVVDKFTKYGYFIPLAHPFTALQVAQAYLSNIYKLHGLLDSIISDRDKIFTSKVWQELFILSDTQLLMSSSYHPQTDGQTERLNQCLETFLRCTVHSCPKQWFKWLPIAEFWYNTSFHSALQRSPFEVLYGHQPKHFGISNLDACSVPELEEWLKERNLLTELIQQQLL
ncbi:uncharacterized protein LOC120645545 [Panicum virgatum]|uniref:uncharacterized protein LOC120645545 n=1 Tax=Panicum virgatum TaxID=38727 RepID=UPI0019D5E995|nr:uncharacterized protein LOC120645545 [Panicum virgatum]